MGRHRFLDRASAWDRPAAPPQPSFGFVVCPAALIQGMNAPFCPWQQHVYQMAFQQAQADLRPSLLERAQTTAWN